MYHLAEIRDMVRVPPSKFNLPLEQAVIEELNRKLSNKIVLNVGLCVCVFDIIKMEDSYIYPGDGASHTRTTFNCVVFRPCIEEILEGVVEASSPLGLQVSIQFFNGIFVKPDNMMTGSYYDETEKVWIWNYQDEHKLFMDVGHKIQLRVMSEKFVDTTPSGPDLAAVQQQQQTTLVTGDNSRTTNLPAIIATKDPLGEVHPYTIYGSIDGDGLGMLKWWGDEDEEVEEGEGEEMAEEDPEQS